MTPYTTAEELEDAARRLLPSEVYDYIAGGADDERALRANRAAFNRFALRPRVLAGLDGVDTSIELLGGRRPTPLLVAPMGTHRMVHPDGELASAAGAAAAGVGYVTSSAASCTLEDIAAVAGPAPWFQLYWVHDRDVTADLVRRAVAAGYGAICLTVDMPAVGLRRRDLANGFVLPSGVRHVNLDPYEHLATGDDARVRYFGRLVDSTVSWDDLDWLRSLSDLPLVIKGVMTGADADRAVDAGVDAVFVSNHGGRQLGRAPSTLDALEEVAAAVDGRLPVILDGGVLSAADVVIALALGASAVAIGRPVLWALATGGEDAVQAFLRQVVTDLERTMTMMGVDAIARLAPAALARGECV